ncbi:hypothetical protein fh0823_25030 [Francisella halioticida]|uniref:hypothetical protein n=1 Tax=Francisella halioticida TaxID=549298 RepID=UPI0012FC1B4B|nr:hypothetical protein [Francisella halioticida]BCD92364.1 hypothetical protein fh0823_25030 [Francisella halioticida]
MLQCLKYFKYNYLLSNRLLYITIRTPSKIKEVLQIGGYDHYSQDQLLVGQWILG